jgi:tetratricopeptide (TPR) repeat protein
MTENFDKLADKLGIHAPHSQVNIANLNIGLSADSITSIPEYLGALPSKDKNLSEPNSEMSIQKPENSDLNLKKAQLAELEESIKTQGGFNQCSEMLLIEYASLKREIKQLESLLSVSDSVTDDLLEYGIPSPTTFIDRPRERERIEGLLRSPDRNIRNIVLHGMGGIGKTLLAIQSAKAVEGLFKRVIWISANDRSITLTSLLEIVLRGIGYRSDQLTIDQKRAQISELLSKDPYLLIVDSFERIGDKKVDNFIAENIFYPSKVLITTRYFWPRDSHVTTLEGFDLSQTSQMLNVVGKNRGIEHDFTNKEVQIVQDATDGLPFAISLMIGQLAQGIPLKRVTRSLTERIQRTSAESKEVWTSALYDNIFADSWDLLDESARRILMSMTFFAAPASEDAIQMICGISQENFQAKLERLISMSLLIPSRNRIGGDELRCSIHPLTRNFAEEQIDNDPILKRAIYSEAVKYFSTLMEQLGKPGLELSNYDRLEQDLPNCLAAFEWCRNQREIMSTLRIVENLNHFLFERGFWDTRIQICGSASQLEYDASNSGYESSWELAFWAGWVYNRQNNYEEARRCLNKAQENLDKVSDRDSLRGFYQAKNLQLDALITHGEAVEEYKRNSLNGESRSNAEDLFIRADTHHNEARDLLESYVQHKGSVWTFEEPDYAIALVDSNQGDLFVDMGHWKDNVGSTEESRHYYSLAQQLYSKVLTNAQGSQWANKDALIAFSAANLGHVEIWLAEKPLADKTIEDIRRRFDDALKVARFLGRTHTIAWCYRGFGLLEQRSAESESSIRRKEGKLKDAQNWLRQALDNFERLGRQERCRETEESLNEVDQALTELKGG